MSDKNTTANDWHDQETYKSMVGYGKNMLNFCFLTNGVAIVSVLTFVGHLECKKPSGPNMILPVELFLAGLLFAGISGILAYMVQITLFNEDDTSLSKGWSSHARWLRLALLTILISMGLFAFGALTAARRL